MSMQVEAVKQEPVPVEIGDKPIKQEHHDEFPEVLPSTSKSLPDDDKEALRAALKFDPEEDTKIFPSTSKIDYDDEDDMFEEDFEIKKENAELKVELMSENEDNESDSEAEGLSDYGGEGPSDIKTEEVMIKSESGDSDTSMEKLQIRKKNVQYACLLCQFKTFPLKNLKRHIASIHKKADICCPLKKIYRPISLHGIKKQSAVVKRKEVMTIYTCDFCNYKTSHKALLRVHIVNRHDTNLIKKYDCDLCDFQTDHKRAFDNHKIMVHELGAASIYSCDICDHKTLYEWHLKRHRKTVHLVDKYECKLCSYETDDESYLKQHRDMMH